jgi:hypothetical protein
LIRADSDLSPSNWLIPLIDGGDLHVAGLVHLDGCLASSLRDVVQLRRYMTCGNTVIVLGLCLDEFGDVPNSAYARTASNYRANSLRFTVSTH